jgi:hypothetical protein
MPTPKVECKRDPNGPQYLGWCMTGHHDNCRVEYIDWNGKERRCGCLNHKEAK